MKLIRDDEAARDEADLTPEEAALADLIVELHELCERLDQLSDRVDDVPPKLVAAARARLMLTDDRDECNAMSREAALHLGAVRDRAALLAPRALTALARVDVTQTVWVQ